MGPQLRYSHSLFIEFKLGDIPLFDFVGYRVLRSLVLNILKIKVLCKINNGENLFVLDN